MEITLKRTFLGPHYTIGKLFIDGIYICDTLEDTYRDLSKEKKVYGETCIPFGKYRVKITYSNRFKRDLPELLNVEFFTGIRIHAGLFASHTEGCILTGKNTIKGQLTESKECFTKVYEKIDKAIEEGKEVYINIVRG